MMKKRARVILHCDCDAFYASVESLKKPEYNDVPMAVAGNPENRHGIILAKNELAKGFGIVTAETVWQAKRKCPALVLVPPHQREYVACSKKVNQIYSRYTDLMEPFSIDETFLDVTGTLHLFGLTGEALAYRLQEEILREVGITVSFGVSFNKAFAKLGSDYNKPRGVTVISQDNFKQLLYHLPVSTVMYAGPKVTKRLRESGITTIGELAACSREAIVGILGNAGTYLWEVARGLEHSPVMPSHEKDEVKSVSKGSTFSSSLVGEEKFHEGIAKLADQVAERLKKKSLFCKGVGLTIRDDNFKNIRRQMRLEKPTQLFAEIFEAACKLLHENWPLDKPARMVTVSAYGIVPKENVRTQRSLFYFEDEKRERQVKLEEAVHRLREQYGPAAIYSGALVSTHEGEAKAVPEEWDLTGYRPFRGVEDV